MKHGKRELPRQHRNRKGITTLTALVLIFCCTVGGTLAWLVTKTDAVTNTFQPTAVSCEVEEKLDGTTKSDVCIKIPEKDKGIATTQAYVRATYVVNWAKDGSDNTNTVYAVAPVEGTDYTLEMDSSSKWTKGTDGYYYYSEPVAPGRKTEVLFKEFALKQNANVPNGYHLQVTILAEGIQSVPERAVESAWPVTVGADGTLSAKS